MTSLPELIALSEKATAGPWEEDGGYVWEVGKQERRLFLFETKYSDGSDWDALFITALVNWFRENHGVLMYQADRFPEFKRALKGATDD